MAYQEVSKTKKVEVQHVVQVLTASLHDQEQFLQIRFEKDYMIQICNFIQNYEAVVDRDRYAWRFYHRLELFLS